MSEGTLNLRVASACSGAATEHWIFGAIQEAFAAKGLPVTFTHVFVCELKPMKREFLANVLIATASDCCIFADVRGLVEGRCDCDRHGRMCVVKDFDIWISGFSCTSVSKQNMKISRRDQSALLGKRESTAATVQTFYGTLDMCTKYKPPFVFLENVDALKDEGPGEQSNADTIIDHFANISYNMSCFRMSAIDYGLPQARLRLKFVGISHQSTLLGSPGDALPTSMTELLLSWRCKAPSLTSVLLDNDSDEVQNELTKRSMADCTASLPAEQGWPAVHEAYYASHHARWLSLKPKVATQKSPWYPLLSVRQQQILLIQQHQLGLNCGHDLSQSIGRIPTTSVVDAKLGLVAAPTILPQMQLWIGFDRHRVMIGREAMSCQGYPWQKVGGLEKYTEAFLHDLAGNAFPAPSFLAVILAALLTAPWTSRREVAENQVVQDCRATPSSHQLTRCVLLRLTIV